MMKKLKVIVNKTGTGVSAHIPEVDGFVIAADSIENLKNDIRESLKFHIEGLYPEEKVDWMSGEYEFEFQTENEQKVYIVESWGGQWEDSWEHLVGIFNDELRAFEAAEEVWNENGNWISRMEIPLQYYLDNVDTAFKPIELEEDSEEGWDAEFEYIFTDFGGYTKKQWEDTYFLYNDNGYRTDYTATSVYEVPFNVLGVERKVVWQKYGISPADVLTSDDEDDDIVPF